jgi:hypothetical protein
LIERGRKFIFLKEIFYHSYEEQVFYIEKIKMKKFVINKRIIIDFIIFRKKNPNYFYLSFDDKLSKSDIKLFLFDNSNSEGESSTNTRKIIKRKTFFLRKIYYFAAKRFTDFIFLLNNKIDIFLSLLSDITYI